MPSSDPADILIASDAWCTRIILHHCTKLTRDQFHQQFPMGPGSLHETITHIISATRRWTDRLAGRTPRPALQSLPQYPHIQTDAKERTPAQLLALLDEAERDLVQVLKKLRAENALATTVSMQWPGEKGTTKTYTFTKGAVIVHLTTHGYHHRAQCLNMLRHLNLPGISDKLPEPSVTDWQAETELPPTIA